MKSWGLARLWALVLSAIFVAGTLSFMSHNYVLASFVFFCVIDVLLYSHYVLSFSSASVRKRVLSLVKTLKGSAYLLSLFLASVACIFYEPELVAILFGFHFALSEVYSRMCLEDAPFFSSTAGVARTFRFIHFLFLSAGYFFAIIHTLNYVEALTPLSIVFRKDLILFVFLISAIAYFVLIPVLRKKLFPNQDSSHLLLAYLLPEMLFIPIVFILHELRMHWATLVIYHLIFWILLPLFKPRKNEGPEPVKAFFVSSLLPMLGLSVVFFLLYPGYMTGTVASPEFLLGQGYVNNSAGVFLGYHPQVFTVEGVSAYKTTMSWGIVHIVFSLLLSNLNPRRVRVLAR